MENNTEFIKAVPTARGLRINLDRMKNTLTEVLHEMGYNDTLVDILIERNVVDFRNVNNRSAITDNLIQHYGKSVLSGGLPDAIVCESFDTFLIGELGKNWCTSEGNTFRERVLNLITTQMASLRLKVVETRDLIVGLTPELKAVKRNGVIDFGEYGMHLPDADIIIYNPKDSRVLAAVSYETSLREGVAQTGYWKLKLLERKITKHIKVYLIVFDTDEDLTKSPLTVQQRVIPVVDLDDAYILTTWDIKLSKVKLFEHFIDDLTQAVKQSQ